VSQNPSYRDSNVVTALFPHAGMVGNVAKAYMLFVEPSIASGTVDGKSFASSPSMPYCDKLRLLCSAAGGSSVVLRVCRCAVVWFNAAMAAFAVVARCRCSLARTVSTGVSRSSDVFVLGHIATKLPCCNCT
jgi:hypothetical protein